MAHIVDMHQLTKDPERQKRGGEDTTASPRRTMLQAKAAYSSMLPTVPLVMVGVGSFFQSVPFELTAWVMQL